MRSMCPLLLLGLLLGDFASADETPSPALLVLNKGHRGATKPSELTIVDPASGRVLVRIPTGMESHEVAVSADGKAGCRHQHRTVFRPRPHAFHHRPEVAKRSQARRARGASPVLTASPGMEESSTSPPREPR